MMMRSVEFVLSDMAEVILEFGALHLTLSGRNIFQTPHNAIASMAISSQIKKI